MLKTPKKIYTASSNATSSSRLLAAEEFYSSPLQRSELFLHLCCRTCKWHLENFIALKTMISKSHRSLERVKRFIEESLSVLRSLKTSKATDNSVARVLRVTQQGLYFELCKPNPKLKSGCNVWQILWLITAWPWELPRGNEYEHIFLLPFLVGSFPISPKRKHKIDFFALFYSTRPFSISYSVSKFNYHITRTTLSVLSLPNYWEKSPFEGRTLWCEQGRKKPSSPARMAYSPLTGILSIAHEMQTKTTLLLYKSRLFGQNEGRK